MNARLHQLFTAIQTLLNVRLSLVFPIVAYLLLTIPAYFWPTHIMKNLEPYPDGLLYALSARNLALSGNFALTYQESVLPFWVSPLYSYVLFIGYVLNSNPTTFYLVNIVLGLVTLVMILVTMWETTKNLVTTLVAILTFLSHAYVSILPTLPMAENLSLPLCAVAIWALVTKDTASWKKTALVFGSAAALVYTKSASVFLAAAVCLCFIALQWRTVSKIHLATIFGVSVLALLIYGFTVNNSVEAVVRLIGSLYRGDGQFMSFHFILPNLNKYLHILGSTRGQFLWFTTPLSSFAVVAIFLAGTVLSLVYSTFRHRKNLMLLAVLFSAQFPLQLVFYSADGRYIIYSILFFSLSFGWLAHTALVSKKPQWLLLLLGVLLVLIVQQRSLFEQLVANNVLGRSVAWQYQAINHFDAYLSNFDNAVLITALPPFFVGAYSNSNYRVVPLSRHQEFLQKNEFVWGSDIVYDDLFEHYHLWLKEGKEIYISNAYITHHSAVIQDYENYKNYFNFELVSEGCIGACNIYKVSLPKIASQD